MTDEQQSHPDSLDDVLSHCWAELARGVTDRRHGFHQPVIATVDADGRPAARTVVLRRVVAEPRLVICHTDRRSPKVEHLARVPHASWALYDPRSRVQLRVSGPTRVEVPGSSTLADEAWQATRLMSRRCYLAPNAPSSRAVEPSPNLPPELLVAEPDRDGSEAGRANFAVVVTRVDRLDWLRLKHDGHRRGVFEWDGEGGEPRASWLEP